MSDVILIQSKISHIDKIVYPGSMPQALLAAASIVSKHFKVKLIDQRTDKNWKTTLKKELNKNPTCIGITTITGIQIKYMLEICKFIKKHSKIPIILGGTHPTLLPRQTIKNPYIDIVVKGEGEQTFYEIVKALTNKQKLTSIKGIIYKTNKKIIETPNRPLLNLNTLPDLPYYLINIKNYLPRLMNKQIFFLQTSRGCIHNCKFCFNTAINKGNWRAQKAELVIKRIEKIIKKYKIKNFYFTDDNFFTDPKRAEKIIDMIINKKLNITWQLQGTRIHPFLKFSNKFLKKLEQSGCEKILFGIESGSQKMVNFMNKDITIKDIIKANKKLSKTKIYVQYGFMCGFPTETLEDIKKSVKLIFQLMKDNPKAFITEYSIYNPCPKTEFYEILRKKGKLKQINNLEGWIDCDFGNTHLLSGLSLKEKKMLRGIEFVSLFIDKKSRQYTNQWWIFIFAEIYRPIAKFRLKHLYFKLMPELWIYQKFLNVLK